jgi:hypothetical protein
MSLFGVLSVDDLRVEEGRLRCCCSKDDQD